MYSIYNDCITLKDRFEGLPLHSACGYGNIEVVRQLVQWRDDKPQLLETPSKLVDFSTFTLSRESLNLYKGKDEEEIEDMKKEILTFSNYCDKIVKLRRDITPLTRACQFGHAEVVKFLRLEKGAKQHPQALIKAIEGLFEECVQLLLFMPKRLPKKLLECRYIPVDSPVLTTPFHELVKHMPDTAEAILHKCTRYYRHLVSSTSLKIQFDYYFVDDHILKRKEIKNEEETEEESEQATEEESEQETEEESAEQATEEESEQESEEETKALARTKESTHHLKQRCTPNVWFNTKEAHPLSLMVEYKREKLLTHPLVVSLIHDKWRSYGAFSLFHWLLYLIFVIITNYLLLSLPNPNSSYCAQSDNDTAPLEDGSCAGGMNTPNDTNCTADVTDQSISRSAMIVLAIIIIIYSLMRLVMEIGQATTSIYSSMNCSKEYSWFDLIFRSIKRMRYFLDLTNWVEVVLFSLATVFGIWLVSKQQLCIPHQNWQIGVVVMWLSWIELIFVSTQFRIIGVYAIMFTKVFKTLLKLIPLALMLISGFALTFHVLLYQPQVQILSLTTGDLDANSFFGLDFHGEIRDTSHLQYLALSTILWIIALILMTILLSNLLIGLAVGDIQSIYDQAKFEKLALQVDYVLTAENGVLSLILLCGLRCRQKFLANKSNGKYKNIKEIEPNKSRSKSWWNRMYDELIYLLWGGIRCDSQESIQRIASYQLMKKEIATVSLPGLRLEYTSWPLD